MAKTVSNSSIAVEHDIICKRGDTFYRQFRYWTDAAKTDPVDITSSTFAADVIENKNKKPVLSFAIGDGFTITDPNILTATKTAEQMELPEGNYKYDLQKTLVDGTVITIQKGSFKIEDDDTQ